MPEDTVNYYNYLDLLSEITLMISSFRFYISQPD